MALLGFYFARLFEFLLLGGKPGLVLLNAFASVECKDIRHNSGDRPTVHAPGKVGGVLLLQLL